MEIIDVPIKLLVTWTKKFNSEIGSGGYAKVYRGITADHIIIAVKKYDIRENKRSHYEREVSAFVQIGQHKNVIYVYGKCETAAAGYIIMQYVGGKTVHDMLCNENNTWQKILAIIKGIASGIHHIHSKGWSHGDIKPLNILLDASDNVKIVDLGASLPFNSKHSNELYCTAFYMSQTDFLSGIATESVDLYAFGVVILQLIMKKQEPDSSSGQMWRGETAQIIEEARRDFKNENKNHVVHSDLMEHGCSRQDAIRITRLALHCIENKVVLQELKKQVKNMLSALD